MNTITFRSLAHVEDMRRETTNHVRLSAAEWALLVWGLS